MSLSRSIKSCLAVLGLVALVVAFGCNRFSAMNQSTPNVKHLTQEEFDGEVLHSPLPVLVDFYATWCAPCRVLSPTIDRVAAAYTGKIKFVKVNVDECPKVAQDYSVAGLPTVAIFKDGKIIDRSEGLQDEVDLVARLNRLVPAK